MYESTWKCIRWAGQGSSRLPPRSWGRTGVLAGNEQKLWVSPDLDAFPKDSKEKMNLRGLQRIGNTSLETSMGIHRMDSLEGRALAHPNTRGRTGVLGHRGASG